VLRVEGLCKHFGGIRAVDQCSFEIAKGSISALIGPNGAGKTTAFNCISRTMEPTAGKVWLDGKRIDHLKPHKVTRLGLSRTFQITRSLEDLTVLENLCVQATSHGFARLVGPSISEEERAKAEEILDFLGISRLAYEQARNLSYGQRKLMDFAALLMSDPKIILLDEPAGGVNPRLLDDIVEHIRALHARGLTVLIVEHNMELVMSLCEHIVVMAQGRVIADGPPDAIKANPEVLEAYLGASTAAVETSDAEAAHV